MKTKIVSRILFITISIVSNENISYSEKLDIKTRENLIYQASKMHPFPKDDTQSNFQNKIKEIQNEINKKNKDSIKNILYIIIDMIENAKAEQIAGYSSQNTLDIINNALQEIKENLSKEDIEKIEYNTKIIKDILEKRKKDRILDDEEYKELDNAIKNFKEGFAQALKKVNPYYSKEKELIGSTTENQNIEYIEGTNKMNKSIKMINYFLKTTYSRIPEKEFIKQKLKDEGMLEAIELADHLAGDTAEINKFLLMFNSKTLEQTVKKLKDNKNPLVDIFLQNSKKN